MLVSVGDEIRVLMIGKGCNHWSVTCKDSDHWFITFKVSIYLFIIHIYNFTYLIIMRLNIINVK